MRYQHGSYSVCLTTLAWLATLGVLSAGEVMVAAEPPAELFQIIGPSDSCAETACPNCKGKHRQPVANRSNTDWIGPISEVLVDWNFESGNASVTESAWQFDAAATPFRHSCAACCAQSCLFGTVDDTPFGCTSTAFNASTWDAMTVQRPTTRPTESANLEPGEPAEVLLEIRNQLGMGPLGGTLYQPVDAVTECKARNTFVAEIRASEQSGAVKSTPSCPGETLARECSLQVVDSVARAETIPSDQRSALTMLAIDELTEFLRRSSRELELSANTFEDWGDYSRADRLREIATELRMEARAANRAKSHNPPTTATPADQAWSDAIEPTHRESPEAKHHRTPESYYPESTAPVLEH